MYKPPYLKRGDTIYILSTARKISIDEIKPFLDWIEGLGLRFVLGETLSLESSQYAGTDDERASDFQRALDRDDIQAIWFARGGYGSIRIFDKIVWDRFIEKPKWLIGFSDITIWHNLVNQFYGIQSIHALMPITFATNTPAAIENTRKTILGESVDIRFAISEYNHHPREVSGEIIGGNLSILYSLLGTKSGFNTNGKILYIEEIDEYLYHIDRMMISLRNAGKLEGLKALIVGEFFDIKDNAIPFGKSYEEIIREHTSGYSYPVIFGLPSGHISDNHPLMLGANACLKIENENIVLSYD